MSRNNHSFFSFFSTSLALAGAALLTLTTTARADEFKVTKLADDGDGSLRQAILDANAHSGADVIKFADGLEGQISLTSGELVISDSVTIEGPGAKVMAGAGGRLRRVSL